MWKRFGKWLAEQAFRWSLKKITEEQFPEASQLARTKRRKRLKVTK